MTEQQIPSEAVRDSEAEQEIRLLEYWHILVRRRWVALSCLVVIVGATMTFTLLTVPTYQASTSLEIRRYSPEVVEFKEVVNVDSGASWEFHQTQRMILLSQSVAVIAAEKLELWNRPEFAGREGSPLGRLVHWARSLVAGAPETEEPDDQARIAATAGFIRAHLSIGMMRDSSLVSISFEDRDPQIAADVANAVAAAYQQFQLDTRYDTTGEAKEFLTRDVARVQAEVAALERKLQAYGVEKEILALNDGTQDISQQALADINRRFTEAKSRLASAEARYQATSEARPQDLPEVMESPLVSRLRERHAELEREQAKMAERFKPEWPALVQLGEALSRVREQLESEAEDIAANVRAKAKTDLDIARAEFKAVEGFRDAQKREVQRVGQDAIDYASLKTEIDTKRKVLAGLVTRESETETSYRLRETGASNVRVVDRAAVPTRPFKPNKRLNLLMSFVFGLIFGAFVAFFVDHLDNTTKTEQDIRSSSRLTVLGHVPLTRTLGVVDDDPQRDLMFRLDVASHVEPRSQFSETFRNLRTSLLLATPNHPPRHVLVTSCEPADGKSTVAMNLAIVLTQLERKVLLVDADLRKPRLHKSLDLDNDVGLSSYLSGNAAVGEILKDTEISNLQVITSGPIPPNPSELLGSPKLDVLLGEFQKAHGFDHVILDSPPLLWVTDSAILAAKVDCAILVVRSHSTRRDALAQSAARLRHSRAKVIGAVLNAVPEESSYFYPYYRYRHRYYGRAAQPGKTKQTDKGTTRRRKAG